MNYDVINQIEKTRKALNEALYQLNLYSEYYTRSLLTHTNVWDDLANKARVEYQGATHDLSNLPPLPSLFKDKTIES